MIIHGGSKWKRRYIQSASILRDESGMVIVWVLMFMIPVLIMSWIFLSDITQAVTDADYNLKDVLDFAVRAANYQVDDASQAAKNSKVHADRAHAAFKNILAQVLKLDPVTLAPTQYSPLKEAPRYILIVYNGDNSYSARGCPAGVKYYFNGTTLSQTSLNALNFPCTFAITESDVTQGGSGVATVTMNAPGCVVWIKAKSRKVIGNDPIESTRWMASEIYYR
ncbi:MAG: hypothetical protein HPY90_05495 [Syntrophothermus sp.]|uniref:hypothetical protein n=1 Tax=Syntrophothermus sp. TaxID=2736299 RepID=UPI0025801490|nr:hypothetical protein [Syntrophothermus sp.]NSW82718.1 hypothetical protein [Syntrophothermus sp.]